MVQIPRLREWREARALTQVELAELADVSSRSVAGYEAGAGARPPTVRRLAEVLAIEVADLRGDTDSPKAEAPPSQQLTLNGAVEEERRAEQLKYLRALRALVWKLEQRWKEEPPKTSREIAVVLDTMQALVDEGALEQPQDQITASDWRTASEGIELQALFLGLRRLNAIADTVKGDETAQQRRELLEVIPGRLSA